MMKMTAILLFVALLHASASGLAQKITIQQKNVTLKQVFNEINRQTGYNVFWPPRAIEGQRVNVDFYNEPIQHVLEVCLDGLPLTYKIEQKTIIIKEKVSLSPEKSNEIVKDIDVGGSITDEKGMPLPGATIRVKGTDKAVIADVNGNFRFADLKENAVLVISYTGFITTEVAVNGKASVAVILKENVADLEEIVVIGYGSVSKPDLTGSVGVAPIEDMSKAPVGSFAEALAGRIAGVQVNASDGQPGGGINITIRGAGSLTQDTSPLYVIDGFPVEDPDPATLNPEEIESMTILKDASSTAIYGSRGANGVILIETKRGKTGKSVVSLSSSLGFQATPKPMELMSPYEFVKYQTELNPNTANTRAFFANGQTLESYKDSVGVDFQDHILHTGAVQIHNLALRGGNDQTKYSISGSIYDQNGVIINTGLSRYSGRITLDQQVSKKLKAGITANYSNVETFGQIINQGAVSANATTYVLARAWMYRPISANPNQDLLEDMIDDGANASSDWRINPLIDLQNQHRLYRTELLVANGFISYDITPDLTFKSTAGIRQNKLVQERFYNSKTGRGAPSPGNLNGINGSIANIFSSGFVNSNTLNYKKTINKDHTITGLGLFEVSSLNSSRNGYSGRFLPNENLGIDGLDEGVVYDPISSSSRNTLVSYATRWDYNYKSKYLLTVNFRTDGSSKFIDHWGYFPGAAIAWNMHKEGFFKKAFPAVSTSKLRMSYGSNGNNRVGDFDSYARLVQTIDSYSFNNAYPTYAVDVSSVGNPNLQWEKVTTIDLGYELGLLKNRISFEFDIYRKTTENLLLNATLPPTTGFKSAVKNIGKLRNDGMEFTLNTFNVSTKSFQWESNFNISFNKNRIMALTEGQRNFASIIPFPAFNRPLYLAEVGEPAGMMIGYVWEGNYQFEDFDNPSPGVYILKPSVPSNGALRSSIQPGDIKYRDLDGDGTMTDADITFIGRGQPIHVGGFSNNFTYKGFNLNVFFQWSYGNDVYNANRLLMEGTAAGYINSNQFASYANRWSPENPTNEHYRTRGWGPVGFHSSKNVEEASFLRLKTVALGYTIPARYIEKLYLSNLSLSLAAQNLVTWTKYSGMDPEVSTRNSVLTPGYDYSAYPSVPTITFGLKATF